MIYQLKVTLEHIHPSTWKRIQVESKISFYKLHQVLQIVFSWDNDHMHVFDVSSLPDYKRYQGKSKVRIITPDEFLKLAELHTT